MFLIQTQNIAQVVSFS